MAGPPFGNLAELRRLQRFKATAPKPMPMLGPEMVSFFKKSVEKRHTRLGAIGECWGQLIPDTLLEHCALESLNRGTLTVLVDSAPHLYELKQLLLAGLEKQVLLVCRGSGLRKLTLKQGRWYQQTDDGDRAVRF